MNKRSLPLSRVYTFLEPGPVVLVSTAYQGKSNIMALSWQTMIDFEPPIVGCIVSSDNFSFDLLKKSKECMINIPSLELAQTVVKIGNCSGKSIDKFKKFNLSQGKGAIVKAPLIEECFVNLECKVIDASMAEKYNLFIFEVVKAWIAPSKKRRLTVHHCGKGNFVIDGKMIKLPSRKK
jgi:flavin reductase (DIM6/NTAB) family NADH-FMN oxidoreductase RutF